MASAMFGDVGVSLFIAGAAFGHLVMLQCDFSLHLVTLDCHFSWQAQYFVKFG